MNLTRLAMTLAATLILVACRDAPTDAGGPPDEVKRAEPEHEAEEHEALPDTVTIDAEVARAAKLEVTAVVAAALAPSTELVGEVSPDPDSLAVAVARVGGRLVEVLARENDVVGAGEALAVLDSAELARARATLAGAIARAAPARRNAKRLETLAKAEISAGREADAAEAEAATLEAEVTAARHLVASFGVDATAGVEGGRHVVRAPFDSVVLERHAVVGQVVTADQELFRLAKPGRAYFIARLFERDVAKVHVGDRADVRLNAYPGEVFAGVVESIAWQLDPAARTLVARVALRDRKNLLRFGLFGSAQVALQRGEASPKRLVVPLSSVTRLAGRDVVFVREEDGRYKVHAVTLGRSSGGRVEVLEGLREGEPVVADGAFTLKSLVLKSTFGEEE